MHFLLCRVNWNFVSKHFPHEEQEKVIALTNAWFFSRCLFKEASCLYIFAQYPQEKVPSSSCRKGSGGLMGAASSLLESLLVSKILVNESQCALLSAETGSEVVFLNHATSNNLIIPSRTRSLFSLELFLKSIRYKKNLKHVNETSQKIQQLTRKIAPHSFLDTGCIYSSRQMSEKKYCVR